MTKHTKNPREHIGANNPPEDLSAFDEQGEVHSDPVTLKSLMDSAKELVKLETDAVEVEELLKKIKGRANHIKTVILPDKMSSVGQTEFTTESGEVISVKDFVAGSLPKDETKKATAIGEVVAWGAESIIKTQIVIDFEKKDYKKAKALFDSLIKKGLFAELTQGIHPQTYLATIRERLSKGEEVDADKLGVFVGRIANVTLAKPKKPKKAKEEEAPPIEEKKATAPANRSTREKAERARRG